MIKEKEKTVKIYSETHLPTQFGEFRVIVFRNETDHKEHLAVIAGELGDGANVPVRLHSECLTSEVLGSLKCDCADQLHYALKYIQQRGRGIVLYLRQEGRGIGLGNKIRAYALQERGFDTVEANLHLGFPDDLRTYGVAASMLRLLGVHSVELLTNNPKKMSGLESNGIVINKRVPIEMRSNRINEFYLRTKANKSGHFLQLDRKNMEIDILRDN
jgi:3,4-dihydroxy 2-butanone 4-phosphate synthase/GTP cyclohydrolase II